MDAPGAFPEFPFDVYVDIFSYFYALDGGTGLDSLLKLLCTSRYNREAASVSAVWKPYYDARYKRCVPENEEARRAQYQGDYRLHSDFARRERDREALRRILNDIRTQPMGRVPRARTLIKEFSFNVWDAFSLETQLPVRNCLRVCVAHTRYIDPGSIEIEAPTVDIDQGGRPGPATVVREPRAVLCECRGTFDDLREGGNGEMRPTRLVPIAEMQVRRYPDDVHFQSPTTSL